MELKDEKTNPVIPATPPGSPPPAPAAPPAPVAPPANPPPGDQVLSSEEAAKVVKRLAELESTVSLANKRFTEQQAESVKLADGLKKAVAGYKAMIIQANPDVLPDLVTGDSVEALDASLVKAKEVVGKVKATLEAQTAAARVPAGAPPRAPVDLSALSPREKINLGVQKAIKK